MSEVFSESDKKVYEDLRRKVSLTEEEKKILQLLEKYKKSKVSLNDVYEVYRKWLHIEDEKRIDAVLATAISRKLTGTPLWLFIVGPSGDGKTEQIKALDDGGFTTKRLDSITSKTLIQGTKGKEDDLMPQLQDKLILISDFSQFLKLHPDEKGQVWAQFRQLYDGEMTKAFGTGACKEYSGIRTTMVVGTTPAVDSQILIFQELGTRELLYRTEDCLDKEDLKTKVWENENYEELMRRELNEVTLNFLTNRKVAEMKIPEEIRKTLFDWSEYLTQMRASAEVDRDGELLNFVYPEMPTRILKQLKRFYICLKSLDEEYTDEKALKVIAKIIESSIVPVRKDVLMTVIHSNPSITTSQVADSLSIGKKTAYTQLNILKALKMVFKEDIEGDWGRIKQTDWSINPNNHIIKMLNPTEKQALLF